MSKLSLGPLARALMSLSGGEEERVAFLVGKGEEVLYAYWARNVKRSSIEFEAEPWHVVQAHVSASKYSLEVVGIAHTHPSCPPVPSTLDVRGMKAWPLVWVIACPGDLKAWRLKEGGLEEVEVEG